eukprot:3152329-Pyramimonas_sp.AAC.1
MFCGRGSLGTWASSRRCSTQSRMDGPLHQDATGTQYHGVILKFAEAAMFKHPMSSSGHVTGGRRNRKSKSMWEKGIFLGKTYESDEFLMGTSSGVHLVRTVRRLPEEDQSDLEL